MSGGSYDYFYGKLRDFAQAVAARTESRHVSCRAERRAFAELLERCADAAYAIEWVDSGDTGPGDEATALRAVLAPASVLDQAAERLRLEIVQAQETLHALAAGRSEA